MVWQPALTGPECDAAGRRAARRMATVPAVTERLVSLAAGTVPELDPVSTVRVAAAAGWPATGVWFDASSWSRATTDAVARAAGDEGILILDLEPVFVTPDGDHGDAMIEAAAGIGAANVLVVGLGVEAGYLTDRLAVLGERAAGVGVTCALEFGPLFATPDLPTAVATVERAAAPGLAVLVDALHLARSGGSPADLGLLDDALLPYAQLCDATAEPISDLRTDALDDRLLPGEGDLPLGSLLDVLPPSAALSVELRSARLRREHDPAERAAVVLDATRRLLGS